jgi:hypothetical protein
LDSTQVFGLVSRMSRPGHFTVEDFRVEVERRQATCPAGKPNDQCSRLDGEKNDRAAQDVMAEAVMV